MAIETKDYPHKIKTNLWANKNYTIFFYSFKNDGKKHRGLINLVSESSWNKRERVSKAEENLIKIKADKRDTCEDKNVTLDKYLTKHLNLQQEDKELKTKKSFYKKYMQSMLGRKPLKDIRPTHIKEVLKHILESGRESRSQVRAMDILRPIFREAIENRIIIYDPTANIKIKRPPTKKIVSEATKELEKIHSAIISTFKDDYYYQALFLFALQGRRKSEILNLKWEDINMNKNFYILRNTKNNEEQRMYLPDNIKNLLLSFKDDSWEYVFTSPVTGTRIVDAKRAIDKIKKALNNQSFGLHYLRNVITSAMAEQGLESIFLSGALGHKDPNTIKKYLTLNYLKSSEIASGIIDELTNPKK